MDMNETFSFKRFFLLAAKRYAENGKRYLFGVALAAAILVLLLILYSTGGMDSVSVITELFFMPVFIGASILMVQNEMKPLRDRHSNQITGTLPASRLEQYILSLLNTTLVMAILFMAVFCVVAGVYSVFSEKIAFADFGLWDLISNHFLLFGFLANSVAMYAASTRMRNQIWALVVVLVIAIPLLGLPHYLPYRLHDWGLTGQVAFDSYFDGFRAQVTAGGTTLHYSYASWIATHIGSIKIGLVQITVWMLLFWTTAYFKFRKRQLI